MKRILFLVIFLAGINGMTKAESAFAHNISGGFYEQLAPHGVWMEFSDGVVFWRPTIMRRGWAPYSVGRWIWTEYGWYWDSYESFGYITYHYGRWYYDNYYGWIWIPDYDWAPAWVEWRYDNDYIGWAPLPPYAVFSINIGIHFTFNYVTPYSHWHFVTYKHMCDPYVYNHFVGTKYKYRIYSNTKYRNEYGYVDGRIFNRGVDIAHIRSRSGQEIRQRTLRRVSDPNELTIKERDKNSDLIKAYIPVRDELSNSDIRNTDLRKVKRNSSLEVSKVEIGERKTRRDNVEVNRNDQNSGSVTKDRAMNNSDENKKVITDRNLSEKKREIINQKETDNRDLKNLTERQKKIDTNPRVQNDANNVKRSPAKENEIRKERSSQSSDDQKKTKIERKVESTRPESRDINKSRSRSNERTTTDKRLSDQTRKR